MDADMMSLKAQGLIENLSEIDADYDVMTLLDDTMDYIEETKAVFNEQIRRRAKAERIGNTLVGIGVTIMLLAGSGIDVPDTFTANVTTFVVGAAIAIIGMIARK